MPIAAETANPSGVDDIMEEALEGMFKTLLTRINTDHVIAAKARALVESIEHHGRDIGFDLDLPAHQALMDLQEEVGGS
jgi:hypothetical protein